VLSCLSRCRVAARSAKELIALSFANYSAVRRRVLQWWSDVSETDAELMPRLNTRCYLVCGGDASGQGSVARADRYLAGAMAWQLMQAAEVRVPKALGRGGGRPRHPCQPVPQPLPSRSRGVGELGRTTRLRHAMRGEGREI
jgi:hypothetical protein